MANLTSRQHTQRSPQRTVDIKSWQTKRGQPSYEPPRVLRGERHESKSGELIELCCSHHPDSFFWRPCDEQGNGTGQYQCLICVPAKTMPIQLATTRKVEK